MRVVLIHALRILEIVFADDGLELLGKLIR